MADSKKMGRPANEKAVKVVKKLLKKNANLTDRMIAALMTDDLGYKPDPKSVWRWRNMVSE